MFNTKWNATRSKWRSNWFYPTPSQMSTWKGWKNTEKISVKKRKFNCTYLFFFPASHAICVPGCQPMMEGHTASFRLSIGQFYRCGMTKVVDHTNVSFLSLKQNEGEKKRNHWTFLQSIWLEFKGHRVYYHRIVVEDESHEKESILVKCGWMPHHPQRITGRSKRQADELSPDFVEET